MRNHPRQIAERPKGENRHKHKQGPTWTTLIQAALYWSKIANSRCRYVPAIATRVKAPWRMDPPQARASMEKKDLQKRKQMARKRASYETGRKNGNTQSLKIGTVRTRSVLVGDQQPQNRKYGHASSRTRPSRVPRD